MKSPIKTFLAQTGLEEPSVYVWLNDAAKLMKVSDSMMRRLCRTGRVTAIKSGSFWLVDISIPRQKNKRGPLPKLSSSGSPLI